MPEEHKENARVINKNKLLCTIVLIIVSGIGILFLSPVFYLNDDVTMRSILSGAYTGIPDGHAVYMQYPLTGILALLYRVTAFIPWFELFFTACITVCMVLVAEEFRYPVIGCLSAVVCFIPFSIYMHYTLVAALMAGTGVFLLMRGKRNGWSVVLLLLAYMVRSQIGLLSLPFVAISIVWRVASAAKGERKKETIIRLKYCTVLMGCIFLCFLMNSVCYNTPEWKRYLSYNDSRTLLYDYTDFLSTDYYNENYTSYGMSEEEYQILSSYNTLLDAGIDDRKLEEVAEKVSSGRNRSSSFGQELKECISQYYLQIRYGDVPYNYIWIAFYLLLTVGFIARHKWLRLSVLFALGAGRSVIWIYLLWRGRFPERVSLSLYIMELMILLGMGIYLVRDAGCISEKQKKIGGVVLVLLLVYLTGFQWKTTTAKIEQQTELQRDWKLLKEYCGEHSDRFYLADVFSVVKYADYQYSRDTENIMLMGGWMSFSPLAGGRLEGIHSQDAAEALYYQETVSLIADKATDVNWLEAYLQNRFGECELEAIAEIGGAESGCFVEYRVIRP